MMSGRQASREAREDHAKVWMHRSQQNALCAWEDYATERLTIAQAAREKATVRLRRAESLASRRDKLRTVVRKDWQDWLKLADERRQSARRDIGSLEALRERAANVVATREASLREAALRSLDERAKADIDELRPYSAQARVEAMVQHRCNDIAQKRARDAAVLRAEESFHDSWSARVQVPLPATSQEPTPSEEKHPVRAAIEKREQREVLHVPNQVPASLGDVQEGALPGWSPALAATFFRAANALLRSLLSFCRSSRRWRPSGRARRWTSPRT